jgi:phospholipase/carboxylesterase
MSEAKSSRLDELNKLKAKDLKAILQLRRVDCSACVEKSDFIDLILKTDATAAPAEQPKKGAISSAVRTIGELKCTVVQNSVSDFDAVVFVFHGYGASMDNLSPIGSEILRTLPNTRVKFVFPNAPLELQAGSFAWWPLDMEAMFMKMIQEGVHAVFKGPEHPKVEHARRLASSLIDSVLVESQVPYSKVILAGFSQGSWLATDLALSATSSPAALAIFSGGLVFEERWLAQLANRKGLKVLQSHGTKDMLLPIALGYQLRDSLQKGGLDVEFLEFNADHTIPESVLVKFGAMIKNITGGK